MKRYVPIASFMLCVPMLLGGCGGREAPPDEPPTDEALTDEPQATPEASADPTEPTDDEGEGAPAAVLGGDAPAWRWRGAEPGFGDFTLGDPVEADGVRCEAVSPAEHRIEVRCHRGGALLWSRTHHDFVGGAALAIDGETLFVARYSHIRTGCTLYAYVLGSGQEQVRRTLHGLGPVEHSEYLNEVEVEAVDGAAHVFGWESQGRYIEVVRMGAIVGSWREEGDEWVANAVPPGPSAPEQPPLGVASSFGDTWPGTDPGDDAIGRGVELARPGGGVCRFQSTETRSLLECTDASGARLFGEDLRTGFYGGASLVMNGPTLYVARFHPTATGCEVAAYDTADGRELWRRHIFGAGMVVHSRYRNDVELRFESGRLVVYGYESARRYVEVLEPASGRTVGYRAYEN